MGRAYRFRNGALGKPTTCAMPRIIGGKLVSWCTRGLDHPEKMHQDEKGIFWSEETPDINEAEPRAQFCDFDWQPRFSANQHAASVYTDYNVFSKVLFTVGPCGAMYIPAALMWDAARQMRAWADVIERVAYDHDVKEVEKK